MTKIKTTHEWVTSSYSNNGANCIETRRAAAPEIGVRDSKLGEASPVQTFGRDAWTAFLAAVKS
ncbi:DUF397 domain-containing protein [Streptomyces sp. SID3343]|uniref:DUF397 domain-containing protein n=1 Tax=Streptomyces sp. SID3343 TaxID=2690260 RepID=UPI00136A202C|nr:DUF397 domain-containing protein [Streptomyces sp. SID3343]MYV99098.1 DUF397 domain-containing protein [Streptomyces sp. SID3343]